MRSSRFRLASTAAATVLAAVTALTVVTPADAHTVSPVNANASTATRDVLNWLAHLPNRSSNRIASGFFGGYSNSGFSLNQTEELRAATGQYPAILSCDYGSGWATNSDITALVDHSCNGALKSWWTSGGLVTISVHLPSPANANGGGLNTPMGNFADLLNPSTAAGARWRQLQDKMAAGLQDLENAGVPVLFRPFHEVNGDWFWWGNRDPNTFKQVWQQMYTYLTGTKGLDNLLWVYSADFSRGNRTAYYPGASYTDVVGMDAYDDNPQVSGIQSAYAELVGLGKPFAFAEIGPDSQGSFDYGRWVTAFQQSYPKTSYFLAWNDGWGPARNSGASTLFNNSWIANRGEVDLGAVTEPGGGGTTTPPPSGGTLLNGFESGTEGWTGANVTGGPWQVTEWASQGTRALKSDVNLGAGAAYLKKTATTSLSGRTTLRATARVAPWGSFGTGSQAKLYVKTGAGWQWFDGGSVAVTSAGVNLSLSLAGVANLGDVREIGVQFVPGSGAGGTSAVYVDNVTVQ
ncbi:mannan endo-1,4-beta-mannosidase [Micromonospora sediminicola]|uniref:Mannan endo-1,4-beta-mannosidase n=1 Tax=Micromonospora sediminicola TaxID=946078 RepID=A0A1A9BHX6_9ACTN|nr:glycosyl hydrolase [Micromonospora sediminicola]SBT68564.1 mannan endo-1,4-beta-mannosidase [Micromonospora sediminicola]